MNSMNDESIHLQGTQTTYNLFLTNHASRRNQLKSKLWKEIEKNEAVKNLVKAGVATGTGVTYAAVILPASLTLGVINVTALGALRLPYLASSKGSDAERNIQHAMDRLTGSFLDLIYLNRKILETYQAFEPSPVNRTSDYKGRPVIVGLHGLFDNKTRLQHLIPLVTGENRDSDKGITPGDFYFPSYGKPITTEKIDDYALDIAIKLAEIRENRNYQEGETMDVIIDAHSMGGLVAVRLMQLHAKEAGLNIVKIIANGTPWEGSPIAPLGSLVSKCAKEMDLENDFINQLRSTKENKLSPEQKKRISVIASKGDTLVPYDSARGKDTLAMTTYRTEVPEGHLSMLYNRAVLKENTKLIKNSWEAAIQK